MELFEYTDNIFNVKSMLTPAYIPDTLIARTDEIKKVAELLKPGIFGSYPHNAFIYGSTGTGKTVVIRYVMQKFLDKLSDKNICNVCPIYLSVRGWAASQVMSSIIRALNPGKMIPERGISIPTYFRMLWNSMNEQKISIILIFDEVDMMKSPEILYDLSRAMEDHKIEAPLYVNIIGLTNDSDFASGLNARISSSLRDQPIFFPPYNAHQLEEILEGRRDAYMEGVLDECVIKLCAAYSAQDNGDARKAIELFRYAGETAERMGSEKVTEEHVKIGRGILEADTLTEVIYTLPINMKQVLEAIYYECTNSPNGIAKTGDIYHTYIKLCEQNANTPVRESRLSQIISELSLQRIIITKLINKGRGGGRTRKISLNASPTKYAKALNIEVESTKQFISK